MQQSSEPRSQPQNSAQSFHFCLSYILPQKGLMGVLGLHTTPKARLDEYTPTRIPLASCSLPGPDYSLSMISIASLECQNWNLPNVHHAGGLCFRGNQEMSQHHANCSIESRHCFRAWLSGPTPGAYCVEWGQTRVSKTDSELWWCGSPWRVSWAMCMIARNQGFETSTTLTRWPFSTAACRIFIAHFARVV